MANTLDDFYSLLGDQAKPQDTNEEKEIIERKPVNNNDDWLSINNDCLFHEL